MLTDFADDLTKASEGASPEMTAALKANIDAALDAAKDKDPGTALDTPETAKAGKELNALCKAPGAGERVRGHAGVLTMKGFVR
ncbi:hypothetical protein ACTI_44820 [Actinoplanes sp. OR16]|uniref:hypothetical protein n=1 Tax=Actinoplanes sp. OR16 TaxID=946334 RepID=UPI000F6C6781|nr:hypothetical protein [Actinoplanes sp. OR16]BBH67797.1 hypothetical protein ACTI_44820 [Actinoplanes sp. OR16]